MTTRVLDYQTTGIIKETFSKIHTFISVPESEPRRGSAMEAGFSASANSARLTSTSPRILDLEVPCFFHEYGEDSKRHILGNSSSAQFDRNQHLDLTRPLGETERQRTTLTQILEQTMATTSLQSLSSYVLVRES